MTQPSVSVALTTDRNSASFIEAAEQLGYERAWLYDIPHQGLDVWTALHQAAARTTVIGLGPGVLVPSLRHPVVNAAQTASLTAAAPGRVAVAFGTGFSSRAALGQKPVTWAYLDRYVRAYRTLLRGGAAEWDGARIGLLPVEAEEFGLPLDVPILLSAFGPKGAEHARSLGVDGIFGVGAPSEVMREFPWAALLVGGTVLREGEASDCDRVLTSAAPTSVALAYHFTHAAQGLEAVRGLPGGQAWADVVARQPAETAHLSVHRGHLAELNEADRAGWKAGGDALLTQTTLTGTAAHVQEAVAGLMAQGVTEIVYQPCGPDIPGELERFMNAAAAVRAS